MYLLHSSFYPWPLIKKPPLKYFFNKQVSEFSHKRGLLGAINNLGELTHMETPRKMQTANHKKLNQVLDLSLNLNQGTFLFCHL